MAKMTQFESGAICAAKVVFEQGEDTLAFEIISCCVDKAKTRKITEFDELDRDMIQKYRENADSKDAAWEQYHNRFAGSR